MIENPKTVADRAANYFGVYDRPRTSIKVGTAGCLMVVPWMYEGKTYLLHYDEEYTPKGDLVRLTPRQRDLLAEALATEDKHG